MFFDHISVYTLNKENDMKNSNKTLTGQPSYPWKTIIKRAAIIAIIIGSSLTLVNQTDAVFGNAMFEIVPLALVFLTPFLVVSVSQIFGIREAHKLAAHETLGGFLGTLFIHGIPIRAIALGLTIGVTNIIIVAVANSVQRFEQLPLALMIQGLTLPIVFGAISQNLSFRRTFAQITRT